MSAGALDPIRRPDLTNTYPAVNIGPFPQWSEPARIVSLDPWGHLAAEAFKTEIAEGIDIRPTIAVTKARLDLHEMQSAIAAGRLKADGDLVHANGSYRGFKNRHRSGVVSARHRRALQFDRNGAAAHFV